MRNPKLDVKEREESRGKELCERIGVREKESWRVGEREGERETCKKKRRITDVRVQRCHRGARLYRYTYTCKAKVLHRASGLVLEKKYFFFLTFRIVPERDNDILRSVDAAGPSEPIVSYRNILRSCSLLAIVGPFCSRECGSERDVTRVIVAVATAMLVGA